MDLDSACEIAACLALQRHESSAAGAESENPGMAGIPMLNTVRTAWRRVARIIFDRYELNRARTHTWKHRRQQKGYTQIVGAGAFMNRPPPNRKSRSPKLITCEGSNGVDVDGSEPCIQFCCCCWACGAALAKLNCVAGGGPLYETSKAFEEVAAPDNGGEGRPGAE